jgi:hypothetical protein
MWELKHLFDPTMTINPGVVLNRDPDLHMKNLKQAPAASPIVDSQNGVSMVYKILNYRTETLPGLSPGTSVNQNKCRYGIFFRSIKRFIINSGYFLPVKRRVSHNFSFCQILLIDFIIQHIGYLI